MSEKELEVLAGGVTYPVSSLSVEARAQVNNLQYVDSEIARLNAQLAIYNTAKRAYQAALKDLLPRTEQ